MPEPLDKLLNKGLDQKFQSELPPIDESSDASMDAPAPPEEQISVDQLKADEKFRQSADLLHILYEGEKFDGPEDALAEYGMDIMAEFNINFAGPGGVFESNPGMLSQAAQLVASGSKEHAQAFLYMNKRYAQLPNFVPSVMGRTFMAMLRDPTMYTGFGTLGAGLVARKLGKEGVQYGIKKALTAMTRIPMNAPARTGGAFVGTMTGGANIARQDIERTAEVPARMEQGLGESLTETAINTAIGSVTGMAMIKGIEKAAPVVVEGAKNLYKRVMGKDGADEKAVINEVVKLLAPAQQAAPIEPRGPAVNQPAPVIDGFQNSIHENPLIVGSAANHEGSHVAEVGYAYRSIGDAELQAIRNDGFALPPPGGKSKGGRKNVKHWSRADGKLYYRPDQIVIRIRSENLDPDTPASAKNIEVWNKGTGSFEPVSPQVSNAHGESN